MTNSQEASDTEAMAEGVCPNCGQPRPDLATPCPHCGAAPAGPASPAPVPGQRRSSVLDAIMQVRSADLEPYIGLRYLSKLFRIMAIIIVFLLIAEVITGFVEQGSAAIPTLLGEASKLLVMAGLLWGIGDLAILLIDLGHDVRATRILMGRQAAHHIQEHHDAQHRPAVPPAIDEEPPLEKRPARRTERRSEGRR